MAEGDKLKEDLFNERLEQMRRERQRELKAIERLGSAEDGRRRALQTVLGNRGTNDSQDQTSSSQTAGRQGPASEAVLVEVRGLFESRPVSNILQSSSFRRELESLVRSGLSRFQQPRSQPRLNVPSTPSRSAAQPPQQLQRPHSPTPSTSSASSMFSDVRLGNQDSDTREINPIPTLSLSEIERIRREEFVMEISELLHNQLVTSTLESGFRNHLERSMRTRVEQLDQTAVQRSVSALERLPPSNVVRNDFSHLGLFTNNADINSDHDDGISIVSATAAAVPLRETSAAMSRELVDVKKDMKEMKQMMKLMMENQLEMQRFVRQEMSATIATADASELRKSMSARDSSTPVSSAGLCLICLETKADTAVYKCGHLCLCQICCGRMRLRSEPLKCPVCRAPVTDLLRVFNTGVSNDEGDSL